MQHAGYQGRRSATYQGACPANCQLPHPSPQPRVQEHKIKRKARDDALRGELASRGHGSEMVEALMSSRDTNSCTW